MAAQQFSGMTHVVRPCPLLPHDGADRILQCWMQRRARYCGRRKRLTSCRAFGNPVAATRPARRHNLYFAAGFLVTGVGTVMVAYAWGNFKLPCPSRSAIRWRWPRSVSGLPASFTLERRKLAGWIAIPALLWIAGKFVPAVRRQYGGPHPALSRQCGHGLFHARRNSSREQ